MGSARAVVGRARMDYASNAEGGRIAEMMDAREEEATRIRKFDRGCCRLLIGLARGGKCQIGGLV